MTPRPLPAAPRCTPRVAGRQVVALLEHPMPWIRFTQDRQTVEAQPQAYAKGEAYELPQASCDRWVARRAAVPMSPQEVAVEKRDRERARQAAAKAAAAAEAKAKVEAEALAKAEAEALAKAEAEAQAAAAAAEEAAAKAEAQAQAQAQAQAPGQTDPTLP